jgi:hydrogenase expression/formation protein HypE
VRPAQILAATASSEPSASSGNCARRAKRNNAWKAKLKVKSETPFRRLGKIRGVLFDFDGTLTMPGALDFPAIKMEIGCPPDLAILEYLQTLPSHRKGTLLEILESEEEKAAEQSMPNIGAELCIGALKQKGMLLGIITRNSLQSVHKALQKFKTFDITAFATIISRDDSLPKPHPEGVHQAAKRMGVSMEELLVVGDFRFDIIAGHEAGARTVLLTNGREPVMFPGDPEPDYSVTCLEEILEIVDALNPL